MIGTAAADAPEASFPEAFFLYAETFLPDAAARDDTLRALEQCATGTWRETPGVATYVFRPSGPAEVIGQRLHPGSLALESTELYLTHDSFRRHLTTEEFRSGLRAMYKGTRRLGARIFWIGARPPADIVHKIFRSDPEARPIAPIALRLFDPAVFERAAHEDVVVASLLCPVAGGGGAAAIDAVDALAADLRTISLAAFFHPLAPGLLRLFMVLPVDAGQPAPRMASALRALAEAAGPQTRASGVCLTHRSRADLAGALRAALDEAQPGWDVRCGGYSGYAIHPAALKEFTV